MQTNRCHAFKQDPTVAHVKCDFVTSVTEQRASVLRKGSVRETLRNPKFTDDDINHSPLLLITHSSYVIYVV